MANQIKFLAAATFGSLLGLIFSAVLFAQDYAFAQSNTNDATVQETRKTNLANDSLVMTIHHALAGAVGDKMVKLEVSLSTHQVTIDLLNSRFNGASADDRIADAVKLANITEKTIKGKTEYRDVTTIHIIYNKIDDGKKQVLQSIDFFQSPAGVFVMNKS